MVEYLHWEQRSFCCNLTSLDRSFRQSGWSSTRGLEVCPFSSDGYFIDCCSFLRPASTLSGSSLTPGPTQEMQTFSTGTLLDCRSSRLDNFPSSDAMNEYIRLPFTNFICLCSLVFYRSFFLVCFLVQIPLAL